MWSEFRFVAKRSAQNLFATVLFTAEPVLGVCILSRGAAAAAALRVDWTPEEAGRFAAARDVAVLRAGRDFGSQVVCGCATLAISAFGR